MADEKDPLVALLDKSPLTKAQKRGLWDLYTSATDTDDLQKRMDALQLPVTVKRDLWNLKAGESGSTAETTPASIVKFPMKVSIGMGPQQVPPVGEIGAEPNGITKLAEMGEGLVRPKSIGDVLALFVPNAIAPTVRGTAAAVKEAVETAATLGGNAKTKPFRAVLQNAISPPVTRFTEAPLYRQMEAEGIAQKASEAATDAVSQVPPVRPEVRTPMGFLKPDVPPMSPLELTRKLRAEHQAVMGTAKAATATPETVKDVLVAAGAPEKMAEMTAEAASHLRLTAEEVAYGMARVKRGIPPKVVEREILAARALKQRFGLPGEAEVAAAVRDRNATGRWPD